MWWGFFAWCDGSLKLGGGCLFFLFPFSDTRFLNQRCPCVILKEASASFQWNYKCHLLRQLDRLMIKRHPGGRRAAAAAAAAALADESDSFQPWPVTHPLGQWPSPLCLVLTFCSILASFISGLFHLYEDLYFTYLEINPLGNWSLHHLGDKVAIFHSAFCSSWWSCLK